MNFFSNIKYVGATPGADANVYTLFTTALWPMANAFANGGARTLTVAIKHVQAGTLKWWFSADRGVNWLQIDQEAIVAPASTSSTTRVYQVDAWPDWKIEWTNGGVAQNPWALYFSVGGEYL